MRYGLDIAAVVAVMIGFGLILAKNTPRHEDSILNVIAGEEPADVVTLGLYADVDALRKRGLIADAAKHYLAMLYRHVRVLDAGSRGATTTFMLAQLGDLQLT